MLHSRLLGILAAAGAILCAGVGHGAWFMALPQLPGSTQAGDAFAVSADGSTVVGTSHDGSVFHAVRWIADGTVHKLGASDFSFAWDVSADGSTIVGNGSAGGFPVAFRWTQTAGVMELGDFSGGTASSSAHDVSADGTVVVGYGTLPEGSEAFRWTLGNGMVSIGDLPGGVSGGGAYGTSSDASIIVGTGVSENGIEAFRWSEVTGMFGLGELPGGGFFSEAYDVSVDGKVVVGRSSAAAGPFNTRAFRWTAETGMTALPDGGAELGPTRTAEAISGDGNVIVGSTWGADSAFVWDGYYGTRSITALLENQGVDVGGWDLGIARGVSYDGLTIVGQGLPPGSRTRQPWVARLDPGTFIPEPSSLLLVALAFFTSLAWWRSAGTAA